MVIAFPRYKGNKNIMSQCKLTAIGRHTVCQGLSRFYTVSLINERTLVYAGALVGTHELN